jgi:hypothetical protein
MQVGCNSALPQCPVTLNCLQNPVSLWLIPNASWVQFCSPTMPSHFKIGSKSKCAQIFTEWHNFLQLHKVLTRKHFTKQKLCSKRINFIYFSTKVLTQNIFLQNFSINVLCVFVKLHTQNLWMIFLSSCLALRWWCIK